MSYHHLASLYWFTADTKKVQLSKAKTFGRGEEKSFAFNCFFVIEATLRVVAILNGAAMHYHFNGGGFKSKLQMFSSF